MKVEQLGCGIWPLIENGITEFEREHGRKLLTLVLHPAHANELCTGAQSDETILDGISVIQDSRVTMLRPIDERGDTYEI